ncbi:hypothetical protein ESCO_001912 [Escovopsis weberi]|uniref:Uncharacterized protein n=1 Tax=Escovopsis weberi TaxID=150374 RepID=A0A0M8MZN5_ESCWE|nr:hypothetical protein ESCO_001912 [Escovopsis weberi]
MHFGSKMKYTAHDSTIPDLHPVLPVQPAVKTSASQPRLRKPVALSSHPRPFDPDELTRKLHGVLAEQQAYADRKRRARAAAEAEREARYAAQQARADAQHPTEAISLPQTARDRRPGAPALKLQTGGSTTPGKSRRESLRRLFGASPTSDEQPTPTYHHVPQVAASQFARTTTVESLTDRALVHELSRRTLNGRPEGFSAPADDAPVELSPVGWTKALRRTQSLREDQHGTSTPRFTRTLDATAETDELLPTQRLTQENLCDLLRSQGADKGERNMSDVFQRIVASLEPPAERPSSSPRSPLSPVSPADMKLLPNHCEVVGDPHEHRVDWTQSDEIQNHAKTAPAQQPLRKSESRWALKSRLASFSKGKGDKQAASPIEEKVKEAAMAQPKFPLKLGFLARFKR